MTRCHSRRQLCAMCITVFHSPSLCHPEAAQTPRDLTFASIAHERSLVAAASQSEVLHPACFRGSDDSHPHPSFEALCF